LRGYLNAITHRYVIALGSNRRHPRHGLPCAVIGAALHELEQAGIGVVVRSRVIASAPLGPSQRRFANAAALIECGFAPPQLLAQLKAIEARFGRRQRGQKWRERVLDLDIVLWSGGCWQDAELVVPHLMFRNRHFVLGPAALIAGGWRDPVTGLTLRQLYARLTRQQGITR
jgi:2-amino-4-hydroxy-6-hydroxymethyldihydropteridine diphosphokinase